MKKISANLLLSALAISIFALAGSTSPALSKCIQKHPIFGIDVYLEDKYCPKKPVKVKAVKKKTTTAVKPVVKRRKAAPIIAAKPDKRIMKMQSMLASMGYNPGPVDGFNGPQTRKAAGEFNLSNDLPEKASTGSTIAVLTALNGKHSSPEMTKTVAVKAAPPKAVMVSTSAPAFAPASAPTRMSDARVHKMQGMLSSAGYYSGPVDGFDSPETRKAAAKFNLANDLPAKASKGSTIAVLSAMAGTQNSSSGAAPDSDVREMQTLLAGLGYHPGPATGIEGTATMTARNKFLSNMGVSSSTSTANTIVLLHRISGT